MKLQSQLTLNQLINQVVEAGKTNTPLHVISTAFNLDEDLAATLQTVYDLATSKSKDLATSKPIPVVQTNSTLSVVPTTKSSKVINLRVSRYGNPTQVAAYLSREYKIKVSAAWVNSMLFALGLQTAPRGYHYKPTKKGLCYCSDRFYFTIQWDIKLVSELIMKQLNNYKVKQLQLAV